MAGIWHRRIVAATSQMAGATVLAYSPGPQDFALMCAKGPTRNNRLLSANSARQTNWTPITRSEFTLHASSEEQSRKTCRKYLPVIEAVKIALVLDLKTAKALGVSLPQPLAQPSRRGDRMSLSQCNN